MTENNYFFEVKKKTEPPDEHVFLKKIQLQNY